ncbi:auxin-responsive protein SAUR41-like [Spinacia oleracea]|uniref:Auxin-responsive protein SAUR41-like n=1 Tax=Spinacia oleracea TaxID=3562 RepID=A0ABM3QPZ6_SPIOL|nr:auxin-responsive protein SAUR41-like [Spinacia oleracea]
MKAMSVARGRNIRRLVLLRAHHHHRRSLISYRKFKGPNISYNEPSYKRWCNPHTEKVPRGSLPVYVGPAEKRFIIPMSFLSMPDFIRLVEKVAEEFGFEQQGGLKIPCEEDDFEEIMFKCFEIHKTISKTRNRMRATRDIRSTTLKNTGGLLALQSRRWSAPGAERLARSKKGLRSWHINV